MPFSGFAGGQPPRPGLPSPNGCFFRFWRRYAPLLPSARQLTTLLFLTPEQLSELQDPELAAEARAWQQAVFGAYDRWIDTPAFRAEAGDTSLADWLAAVGAVESRAFGFRAPDGSELRAYVPFFCCANHSPAAPTMHLLSLEPPETEAAAAGSAGPEGPGPQHPGAPESGDQGWEPSADMVALRLAPGEEGQLFIDYGKKDTRALVSQYGFVLYGNPYDRLDWGGGRHGPMRRDWVHAAAERLAAALETNPEELAAAPKQGLDPGQPGGAAAWRHPWPGGAAAARVRLRNAAASVVSACGWRSLKERRDVTPATELAAITALTAWSERELRSFPTSPEQDQTLLDGQHQQCAGALEGRVGEARPVCHEAEGRLAEAVGQSSSRLRLAIEYRLERKLLLRAALELVGELRRELLGAG
ncbi:hypothetical protein HYH03_000587 [Edaphochlamys debaryana]|uniref:SET domain-containing protein n=1 Tax=Edaphochlamys debaryana TaxID=47281 RepID=A0A835YFZ1_9CHLO|nr:hypothetical protein HYH03_000587 [Edaphochlamys debaryana]|eukprot:KAG2502095.1 hypothetical protein HYH03_000587 [Edaphochlamys debaryana]